MEREQIKRLFIKYGILLIVYIILMRVTEFFILPGLFDLDYENTGHAAIIRSIVINGTLLLINIAIAIVVLIDSKGVIKRWIPVFLTSIFPEAGILYFLVLKVWEMKSNNVA